MKTARSVALLLAAAFLFSGCNIIKVNPERDGAQVVAVVNGENITKKEVYKAARITWEQKFETWEMDDVKTKKEQAMESLIYQKVIVQKAKELGYYTFTPDEQKEIDEYVMTLTQSKYDEALAKYQEQAKNDSGINPEEMAGKDVDAYIESLGTSREELEQSKADSVASDKTYDSVTADIAPTDEEVKAEYDSMLAEQKTAYDADPSQMIPDDNDGDVLLYYPSDAFVRVRHILVGFSDEVMTEINDFRTAGDDAGADAKREAALKDLVDEANEALGKAKEASGDLAKLEELITEYGDDPGMESRANGYLITADNNFWVKEFTDAAMALTEIGVPSELVASDSGYHIIWLTEKVAKGDVPLDAVKDKITELAKSEKQNTAWGEAVTGWAEAAKIDRYTGRLHN